MPGDFLQCAEMRARRAGSCAFGAGVVKPGNNGGGEAVGSLCPDRLWRNGCGHFPALPEKCRILKENGF